MTVPIRLKSVYTHLQTLAAINTVPIKVNLNAQWLPQPYRYKHTASANRNTESVNTHISICPVAISEQLVVQWQKMELKQLIRLG